MSEEQAKILELYNSGLSPNQIAKKLNTYANKVRRALEKLNIKLRTRSEAQSLSLKNGVREHPTAGKKMRDETKKKISEMVTNSWKKHSDEQREKRIEKAKERWKSLTIEERQNMRSAAAKAIREASKNGSRLERYVLKLLNDSNVLVEFHKENLIPNEKMQLDMFLPQYNTVVEIDGPTHFYPIWGEESLKRHLKADSEKNGLLLIKGFNVVRVKCVTKYISQSKVRGLIAALLAFLKETASFTKPCLHEIEV